MYNDPNALQPLSDPQMVQPDIAQGAAPQVSQNPMDQRKRMMMAQMLYGGLGAGAGLNSQASNMLGMYMGNKAAQNTPYMVK